MNIAKKEQRLRKHLKKLFPELHNPEISQEKFLRKNQIKNVNNKESFKELRKNKKSAFKRNTACGQEQTDMSIKAKVPETMLKRRRKLKKRTVKFFEKIDVKETEVKSNKWTMTNVEESSPAKKTKSKIRNKSCDERDLVYNLLPKKIMAKSQWICESTSDEDYVINAVEASKSSIIDNYLEEQMLYDENNEFYYEEDETCSSFNEEETSFYDNISSDAESSGSLSNHIPFTENDLIIHKGTANKRPINETDGIVQFDSDHDVTQIIELGSTDNVKVIKQSAECEREVLLKLSKKKINFTKILNVNEDTIDCPQLVQRNNTSEFQRENMELNTSVVDHYDEFSNSSSLGEENLTAKYNVFYDLHSKSYKKVGMHAHILNAVGKNENLLKIVENDDKIETVEQIIPIKHLREHSNGTFILSANVFKDLEKASNPSVSRENTAHLKNSQKISNDNFQETSVEKSIGSRFFKIFNNSSVLLVLKTAIYIYGTLRFKLLSGNVEVYGFNVPLNKEYEIFSPRGCASVCIKPMYTQQNLFINIEDIFQQHNLCFEAITLKRIKKTYNPILDALVLLRSNEERVPMIFQYKRYMNENVFPNLKLLQPKTKLQSYEMLLNCHINAKSMQGLQIPKDWEQLALKNDSRLMLAGGKAVGKSTLLRILINKYLNNGDEFKENNAVLLVDLDIGQPEIGVYQTISCTLMNKPLLGPGFFLNKVTDISFFVGEINATLCIQRYLKTVKILIEKCKKTVDYENVPWIINTMGYNQGLGTVLFAKCCEIIQPTDVVEIQSNVLINNFPVSLKPENLQGVLCDLENSNFLEKQPFPNGDKVFSYRWHMLKSGLQKENRLNREWCMGAKDIRFASLIAQLSDILLQDSTPWCADLSIVKITSLSDPKKSSKDLLKALTGNVVYLCKQDTNSQIPLECFGIGVVRSVDEEHIYIMPAFKFNMLCVNCIVLSEQPLPTANLKRQGSLLKKTCLPFVYVTEGSASTAVKQIYHRSKHFLRGKYRQLIA